MTPRAHKLEVERWSSARRAYLDNLKVILVALIIAGHGVVGYASHTDGIWPYANVAEIRISAVTEAVLLSLFIPFVVFVIALLFLVAGMLTPGSLSCKGPRRFVRDRLLRLGVPFAVFTLLLWPLLMYALYRPLGHVTGSYWAEILGSNRTVDTGPLWFIGVLLIFSLGYAGIVQLRRTRPVGRMHVEITGRWLLLLVAAVTTTTFLVRLVFPFASEWFADLNFWEWPACIALFGLGIAAAGQGWLDEVPASLRRQSCTATLITIVVAISFVAASGPLGVTEEQFAGGWHWAAFVFAALEGTLTVFGSVWLLSLAQRHLDRRWRLGPLLSRSAYGAFILQGLVLIGLGMALRALPLPAELKALVVAVGGVVGSFAIAWLLVNRVPVLARVL